MTQLTTINRNASFSRSGRRHTSHAATRMIRKFRNSMVIEPPGGAWASFGVLKGRSAGGRAHGGNAWPMALGGADRVGSPADPATTHSPSSGERP